AGSREAGDDPRAQYVITERDNGYRRRCLLGNSGCDITVGQNDVHIHADEFGGKVGELLSTLFGIAELDRRILALNEAQLPQSLTERFQTRRSRGRSAGPQDADKRNTPGLLRACRERPRRRAAEQRYELAAF